MQKFKILYNFSYTSNTVFNEVSSDVVNEVLYTNQQNLVLNQDYYSYQQTSGGGIVNDLNVKEFLDKPANETLALQFINHLTENLTNDEFRDLFYDNKKLAEYFNDYYKKYINFSSPKNDSIDNDEFIDLDQTKKNLFEGDRKFLKTNQNTNYYISDEKTGLSTQLRTTDFYGFSGYNENYYINIQVNQKTNILNSDDFSEYFKDFCEGKLWYKKYNYINSFQNTHEYGNLSFLINYKNHFQSEQGFGPTAEQISLLEKNLPVFFLNSTNNYQDTVSYYSQDPIYITDNEFNNNYTTEIINIPLPNNNNQINNFKNFSEFVQFFHFTYYPWNPDFDSLGQDFKDKYIYQQKISLVNDTNILFNGSYGNSMISTSSFVPNLIKCEYEFVSFPDIILPNQLGYEYDNNKTNKIKIKIRKNSDLGIISKAIVKLEEFSPSKLGEENLFNAFNFLNNNQFSVEKNITFNFGEEFQEIELNIYKNWNVRVPIILSLRPFDNPNQICEYLIIYLEEFFRISGFNFEENIKIKEFEKCNLIYNSFVKQNFNDNFLEYYKPDSILVDLSKDSEKKIFTQKKEFEKNVNNKLEKIYGDKVLTLNYISQTLKIPKESIFNIYVWGSHYFETNDAYSDKDIIIVADINQELMMFKKNNIDFAVYTPSRFQFELNEVGVPVFADNNSIIGDRVFQVYNTETDKFKILEKLKFNYLTSTEKLISKTKEINDNNLRDAKNYYNSGNFEGYTKRMWHVFRVLIFSIQMKEKGKIYDYKAANSYLEEIRSLKLNSFVKIENYFLPKISELYAKLITF